MQGTVAWRVADPVRLAERVDFSVALSTGRHQSEPVQRIETGPPGLLSLAPSSEPERALQTPAFEALQQKADQAMFERRALAVDKERAIAENELANRNFVRAPSPSVATGTTLRPGKLTDASLVATSRMNDGGVIFADGIEPDFLSSAGARRCVWHQRTAG